MNVIAPLVESAFLGFNLFSSYGLSRSDFLSENANRTLVTSEKLKLQILKINALQSSLTYLAIGRIEKILQFKGYTLGPVQYIAPLIPFFLSTKIEDILTETEEKKQKVLELIEMQVKEEKNQEDLKAKERQKRQEKIGKRRLYAQPLYKEKAADLRKTALKIGVDESLKKEIQPSDLEDFNVKQKYLHRACEIATAVSSLALLYFGKWGEGAIPLPFLAVHYLLEYKIIPVIARIMISHAVPTLLLSSGGAYGAIRLYQWVSHK